MLRRYLDPIGAATRRLARAWLELSELLCRAAVLVAAHLRARMCLGVSPICGNRAGCDTRPLPGSPPGFPFSSSRRACTFWWRSSWRCSYGGGRQDGDAQVVAALRRIVCAAVALAALGLAIADSEIAPRAVETAVSASSRLPACSRLLLIADGSDVVTFGIAGSASGAGDCGGGRSVAARVFRRAIPHRSSRFAQLRQRPVRPASEASAVRQLCKCRRHSGSLLGCRSWRWSMPVPGRHRVHADRSRNQRGAIWFAGSAASDRASLYDVTSYQLIWQAARGFAALLPVAICGCCCPGAFATPGSAWLLFGFASMLAWASLVQVPFSAPIYFCYVTPLAVIAAVAVAGSTAGTRRPYRRRAGGLPV